MVAGLTGGIGSGKSQVARLFALLGCAVFQSDEAARDIYFDPTVREEVKRLLGDNAYVSDTQIDRTYISSRVFSNSDLLHRLNRIIHPAVGRKFDSFREANQGRIIIKETALLFEAKLQHQVDKIIVVTAADELRIGRVMARDGLSREDVLKKMQSQLSQEQKISQADFVIDNNEREFLITQVLNIYKQLHAA